MRASEHNKEKRNDAIPQWIVHGRADGVEKSPTQAKEAYQDGIVSPVIEPQHHRTFGLAALLPAAKQHSALEMCGPYLSRVSLISCRSSIPTRNVPARFTALELPSTHGARRCHKQSDRSSDEA
jgi:hypothetical protein